MRQALASRTPLQAALIYLAAITVAELLTAFLEVRAGLAMHGLLLVTLMLHSALAWDRGEGRLLLSLAFAPLIRLLSLAMPLAGIPLLYWYLIISVPLLVAALMARRILEFSWPAIGFRLGGLAVQLLVGLVGLGLGYVEYRILQPLPLAAGLTWQQVWVPVLVLVVSTGFVEELIFRGLMQRTATEILGAAGLWFVALLFAVLHVGYRSIADFVFVLAVGLFFGWVVIRTGSILGVTISHGLTNVMLFIIVPLAPLFNPPPPAPLALPTPLPLATSPTPIEGPTLLRPSGGEIVVDDQDSGFIRHGTAWSRDPIGYQGSMLWTSVKGEGVESWAEWRPLVPQCGTYEVHAFIPAGFSFSTAARYEIHHRGGAATVSINQQEHPGEWVSLGSYEFEAGSDGYVRLTDATGEEETTNRTIAFDAIRWQFIAPCAG